MKKLVFVFKYNESSLKYLKHFEFIFVMMSTLKMSVDHKTGNPG